MQSEYKHIFTLLVEPKRKKNVYSAVHNSVPKIASTLLK